MPPEDSSLVVHLRSCAASCLHGAGSSLPAVGRLPLRRVRRWLLAYLQQDGRAHLTELSDALAHLAPETACDWRESVLRRACRALQSEGRAVYREGEVRLLAVLHLPGLSSSLSSPVPPSCPLSPPLSPPLPSLPSPPLPSPPPLSSPPLPASWPALV